MPQSHPPSPHDDADPSMDDILASIRRILSDEEKAARPHASDNSVLVLDPSMMIDDPTLPEHAAPPPMTEAEPHTPPGLPDLPQPDSEPPRTAFTGPPEPSPQPASTTTVPVSGPPDPAPDMNIAPDSDELVAPEAAAAAASSVGALMRTLAAERAPPEPATPVYRGGPSIEDLVREEFQPLLKSWLDVHMSPLVERLVREQSRPLLKTWLDTHLPSMVERLVRAEIERVVGGIGS